LKKNRTIQLLQCTIQLLWTRFDVVEPAKQPVHFVAAAPAASLITSSPVLGTVEEAEAEVDELETLNTDQQRPRGKSLGVVPVGDKHKPEV
jgi:hypothetical protein